MAEYNRPTRNRSGSFTSKWGLYQPLNGETGWGDDVDLNFTIIDDHLGNKISELLDVKLMTTPADGDILQVRSDGKWVNIPLTLNAHKDISIQTAALVNGAMLRYYKPNPLGSGVWKAFQYMDGFDLIAQPSSGDVWMYVNEDSNNPDPNAPKIWRPTALKGLNVYGGAKLYTDLDMGGDKDNASNIIPHRIINVATPVNPNDVPNKAYVDAHGGSKYWQDPIVEIVIKLSDIQGDIPLGYRVVSATTADGATLGDICTYNGTGWDFLHPTFGMEVFNEDIGINYTYLDYINTASTDLWEGKGTNWHPSVALPAGSKGNILIYDGSKWIVLAPGPVGSVLTSNGPDELPTWEPIDI